MPTLPVILDVDTGVDDACALLLAALHPRLDLRAVTCVGGNAPLADVVRNTLVGARGSRPQRRAGRARRRPSAARGPGRRPPRARRRRHGATSACRRPTLVPDPRHALDLLRDT